MDFVFIDVGHSYETVKHDFEILKHNSQIVLDDFFLEDGDGKKPSEAHCGVNKLFEEKHIQQQWYRHYFQGPTRGDKLGIFAVFTNFPVLSSVSVSIPN